MYKKFIKEFQFYKKLTALPFIEGIILFGSRARGDCMERADIDLAIQCPSATQKDWLTIMQIIDDADTLLKIDCIRLDDLDENHALRKAIKRDGIDLYHKGNNEHESKINR